jgi:hypothetical protein
MKVLKREFASKLFRKMLRAQTFLSPNKPVFLNPKSLDQYVDAEYEVILFHLFFLALFVACPVIVGKLGTQ